MSRNLRLISALLVVMLMLPGCASLKDGTLVNILQGASQQLDAKTVAAGLKEALQVGTERSVVSLSSVDGYLANELIKIAIPEQMTGVTSKLRQIGMGSYVDELETGMNRAAEAAATEARDVFWDAITSMTISDAFGILNGGENAATDYFIGRTRQTLEDRYRPITRQKMQEVGLSRIYSEALDIYDAIPLLDKPEMMELDEYVTTKALDGLFSVLALEEGKIRSDPAARTSDLLRKVFG